MPNRPDGGFVRDPSGALVVSGLGSAVALGADVGPISAQTALQNITGLGFDIAASDIWLAEYFLLVDAANITMDVKLGFAVPAGCTMKWGVGSTSLPGSIASFSANSTANNIAALVSEAQTVALATVAGVGGVSIVALVFGGGTAGTVQIQYAQNTSDAGNLKIDRGSFVRTRKGS